jgi:hypothetical protein
MDPVSLNPAIRRAHDRAHMMRSAAMHRFLGRLVGRRA